MDIQQVRRENLRRWIEKNVGGNIAEMARRCNRQSSQINDMLSGRKSFGEKVARGIERDLQMADKALDFIANALLASRLAQASGGVVDVPVVGEVKGGPNGYLEELGHAVGHGEKKIAWPSVDGNAYALRVRGDSMQPRFKPGDYIVVEPGRVAEPGDTVVVKLRDGSRLLKELLYRRNGEITLGSINSDYRPITVAATDIENDGIQFVAATVSARSSAVREP